MIPFKQGSWNFTIFWGDQTWCKSMTRWWFQAFFVFTPNLGEMIQFEEHIFQMGWFNHQLDKQTYCWWFRNPANHRGCFWDMESTYQLVQDSSITSIMDQLALWDSVWYGRMKISSWRVAFHGSNAVKILLEVKLRLESDVFFQPHGYQQL